MFFGFSENFNCVCTKNQRWKRHAHTHTHTQRISFEDVDAFACLGICEYETLVCKTFQFYLLKFIHRRLDLSAVWFFVWRIMNETSSTMMMTKRYALEPRQLNASHIKWTMFSEHVVFIIILIISLQSKLISLAVNFIKFKLIKLDTLICDCVCVWRNLDEIPREIIRNAPQSFIQFASNERIYILELYHWQFIATLAQIAKPVDFRSVSGNPIFALTFYGIMIIFCMCLPQYLYLANAQQSWLSMVLALICCAYVMMSHQRERKKITRKPLNFLEK